MTIFLYSLTFFIGIVCGIALCYIVAVAMDPSCSGDSIDKARRRDFSNNNMRK